MIRGLGTDIIEINRIQKAVKKNSRFIERIFTQNERILFSERNYHPNRIAGFFAAKEATVKAIGTGIRGMSWKDIEIQINPEGKPYIRLYNNALRIAYSKGIDEILISISHSREYAVAQAIAIQVMKVLERGE